MVLRGFSWFLDMLYLQALAIHSTLFHADSRRCIVSKIIHSMRKPIIAESAIIRKNRGFRENRMERLERKRNVIFLLAPTEHCESRSLNQSLTLISLVIKSHHWAGWVSVNVIRLCQLWARITSRKFSQVAGPHPQGRLKPEALQGKWAVT